MFQDSLLFNFSSQLDYKRSCCYTGNATFVREPTYKALEMTANARWVVFYLSRYPANGSIDKFLTRFKEGDV
ncbi:hypothetical protein RCL_jg13957.t1 [Rhizophagus clarus]|uniref:Uncharacterized protein n=1 Tax=Rhizophagus clarus TaxID=94130 RepID=A0A8H3LN34_9GLOM|nr:hypothetical protein RCL_jg13957.t1 [Rhizophagus clarus]